MNTPALIARKRDGHELTAAQWQALVDGFLDGTVAPEQMSALLMAGVLNGFSLAEAEALTGILLASGGRLDLSGLDGPVVDKHSTGGVGDTTTLVVAPVLAAAGVHVAKLSGAGLGHTGGTLDKLAAIPGVRTNLSTRELLDQVERVGVAVAAASADLAPADKQLYALRDVTGTVPAPALIASSIMSKKLAAGAPVIVLDVKAGDGGVVGDEQAARELAQLCLRLGQAHDRRMACLVTDMSQPLGPAIGNALEVQAALDVLAGTGDSRLRTVSLALAETALALADGPHRADAAQEVLASGAALEKFGEWIRAQGGPPTLVEDPASHLAAAPVRREVPAPGTGFVHALPPRALGEIARELGAGRRHATDRIDPAVGLELHVRVGDEIEADAPLATIHAATEADAAAAAAAVADRVAIAATRPTALPALVRARLGPAPGEDPPS